MTVPGAARGVRVSSGRPAAGVAVAVALALAGGAELRAQTGGGEAGSRGPIRGYVYTGVQLDLHPGSFDRAFGLAGVLRVGDRWFVGARAQGEDREGGGADFLGFVDGGRFLRGSLWGGAHLGAVAGGAIRNGDGFWTAGLRGAGGGDGESPMNFELELRLAGGQGRLEVWSSFFVGFTFPPFPGSGDE